MSLPTLGNTPAQDDPACDPAVRLVSSDRSLRVLAQRDVVEPSFWGCVRRFQREVLCATRRAEARASAARRVSAASGKTQNKSERERCGRARYETLAMSPPSSKRKPVLQRRASTCCSARCGGGGTAPSAGGYTRCGRAGRPRRTTAWAAAGIGGHLRGIAPPTSRRNEGPSSRPRRRRASSGFRP